MDEIIVFSDKLKEGVIFVDIPKTGLEGRNTKIKLGVFVEGELIETINTKFLGPAVYN